jgi:hypothetical protein
MKAAAAWKGRSNFLRRAGRLALGKGEGEGKVQFARHSAS